MRVLLLGRTLSLPEKRTHCVFEISREVVGIQSNFADGTLTGAPNKCARRETPKNTFPVGTEKVLGELRNGMEFMVYFAMEVRFVRL